MATEHLLVSLLLAPPLYIVISWSVGNKKASKSGNTAKASATGVRYTNGHAVQSITRTVTLTCSATGNFS